MTRTRRERAHASRSGGPKRAAPGDPEPGPTDLVRLMRELGPVRQQLRRERLQQRLDRGPIPVVAVRPMLVRPGTHLVLDGNLLLTLWLYRPLDVRPRTIRELRYQDEVGWIVGVGTDHGPTILIAWQLRLRP